MQLQCNSTENKSVMWEEHRRVLPSAGCKEGDLKSMNCLLEQTQPSESLHFPNLPSTSLVTQYPSVPVVAKHPALRLSKHQLCPHRDPPTRPTCSVIPSLTPIWLPLFTMFLWERVAPLGLPVVPWKTENILQWSHLFRGWGTCVLWGNIPGKDCGVIFYFVLHSDQRDFFFLYQHLSPKSGKRKVAKLQLDTFTQHLVTKGWAGRIEVEREQV